MLVTIEMKVTKTPNPECPIGRAHENVGEWWSILILRDAFQGMTRFDEFRQSLGIAPSILTSRLAHLTACGMFDRRSYSKKPPRYEYVLTAKGRDFFPVIASLFAWGNRHLAPEGAALFLVQRETRKKLHPVVVDARSLEPILLETTGVVAGPAASPAMQRRLAQLQANAAQKH